MSSDRHGDVIWRWVSKIGTYVVIALGILVLCAAGYEMIMSVPPAPLP